MNIKVIYQNPENGYRGDREYAAKFLVLGQEYTVIEIDRGAWHTSFRLKETPGWFNSVHFEEVEEGSLQAAYDEIPSDYLIITRGE